MLPDRLSAFILEVILAQQFKPGKCKLMSSSPVQKKINSWN